MIPLRSFLIPVDCRDQKSEVPKRRPTGRRFAHSGRAQRALGGLSQNWRQGVSESSAASGKDAQRRRISGCVKAEDDAKGVEDRRDTVLFLRRTTRS